MIYDYINYNRISTYVFPIHFANYFLPLNWKDKTIIRSRADLLRDKFYK